LLAKETVDTNRVRLMFLLASKISVYNPDTALSLSQQALYLARHIDYIEGESRSLGILANIFMRIGNYPKPLKLILKNCRLRKREPSRTILPAY
jgi:hypothetical protein